MSDITVTKIQNNRLDLNTKMTVSNQTEDITLTGVKFYSTEWIGRLLTFFGFARKIEVDAGGNNVASIYVNKTSLLKRIYDVWMDKKMNTSDNKDKLNEASPEILNKINEYKKTTVKGLSRLNSSKTINHSVMSELFSACTRLDHGIDKGRKI